MFELSNALSIVFISLKLVKLRQVKVLSVAPPKGHETLPYLPYNYEENYRKPQIEEKLNH